MAESLISAAEKVPYAIWTKSIHDMLNRWYSVSDHKWRSNLLWYDYYHNYKEKNVTVDTQVTITCIRIPVAPAENCFEAQSMVDFLRGHLQFRTEHFISGMIGDFIQSFCKSYIDVDSGNSPSSEFLLADHVLDDLKLWSERATKEVQNFVYLAVSAMISYYGGAISTLMKDKVGDLYDLILEEIFSDSPIHSILMKIYESESANEEKLLQDKIIEHRSLQTSDLGIEPPFQLDILNPTSPKLAYFKAIEELRNLETIHSPLQKVDCILRVTRMICESVDDYWRDLPDIDPSQLMINSDQILSLFLYIIIRSDIYNLSGHIKLINHFVRKEIRQSNRGYYVATIEAAIEEIITMNPIKLQKLKDSIKSV